jgi:hypothetical protein
VKVLLLVLVLWLGSSLLLMAALIVRAWVLGRIRLPVPGRLDRSNGRHGHRYIASEVAAGACRPGAVTRPRTVHRAARRTA